ncbi:MAG: HEAT repeat domain-containing protein [Planctomycetota bacterium]
MKLTVAVVLSLCVAACLSALAGEDYGGQVEALLAKLGSENVGDLNGAQQALFTLCAQASAPGAEQRAAACEALASRLAKANPQARVWMLRQLERIGKAETVAAVAALLSDADEKVRDGARRALANNPAAEAALALAKALEGADKPADKVALLNALARHAASAPAVAPVLLKSLASDDEEVRSAAAMALAHSADKHAVEELAGVLGKGSPQAQTTATSASLLLADELCGSGEKAAALKVYKQLCARTGHVKSAALIGLGRAGGAAELDTILEALGDADAGLRGAAVEAVSLVPATAATPALLAKLKDASKDKTIAILRALGTLGDKSAVPGLVAATTDADEDVRVAALRSLGAVADGSAIPALAKAAGTGGSTATAARESLDRISGKDVDAALLACLKDPDTKVRAEAARCMGVRQMTDAVPALLKLAEDADAATRAEVFKALAGAVRAEHLPALAAVVGKTSDASTAAVSAILAAALQVPDADRRADPVVAECAKATGPARLALWSVLGQLGGPKALEVLRAGLKEPDEEVQKSAVRAIGQWPDTSAAEDLLTLAKSAPNEALQVLALRGYIRLAGLAKARPVEAVKMFQTALETAKRADEKRLALGGLGEVYDIAALNMVEPLLDDPALKEEAGAAAANIGKELAKQHGEAVRRVMEKVLDRVKGKEALQKALATHGQLTMGALDVRVANDPDAEKGVNFAYYEGEWDKLPDFDKLKAKKMGKCAYFDLGLQEQGENYGFKFTGFLKLAAKGTYAFSVASDDGSRLLIADKVVVDNDNCHGVEEVIGKIELDAGLHPITVLFFQKGGGAELHVRGGKLK